MLRLTTCLGLLIEEGRGRDKTEMWAGASSRQQVGAGQLINQIQLLPILLANISGRTIKYQPLGTQQEDSNGEIQLPSE